MQSELIPGGCEPRSNLTQTAHEEFQLSMKPNMYNDRMRLDRTTCIQMTYRPELDRLTPTCCMSTCHF